MKRRLSPQEKKVLSYSKDGRNTFAEARSKSRKAIAKHKALANRALRRAEKVAVTSADPFISRTGRRSWRKIPDAPLGEYVGRTLNRRDAGGMNKQPKSSALLKAGRKAATPRPSEFKGPLQRSENDD